MRPRPVPLLPLRLARLLPLLAVLGGGAPLAAQDAAADARYQAAIEWVRLVVVEGDYAAAAAQAHPMVAAQMTGAVIEEAWRPVAAQVGALESLEPKDQRMEQGLNLVILTGEFSAGTFEVLVFMNDEHQVAGFFVRPPEA